MPRMLLTIAALLLSCEAVPAQNAVVRSALGATSPLSGLGSPTSGAPTGIPLGATEIDPGGLSPLPCSSAAFSSLAGSSQSGAAAGTTFDGGGMFSSGCNAAPEATVSSTGNVSPLFTPGATSGSLLSGGSIPLGATEIDNGGVSPMITIPSPDLPSQMTVQALGVTSITTVPTVSSASPSPCTGSTPSGGPSSGVTSGSTSTTGVTSSGC
jgi:hypothetical protein